MADAVFVLGDDGTHIAVPEADAERLGNWLENTQGVVSRALRRAVSDAIQTGVPVKLDDLGRRTILRALDMQGLSVLESEPLRALHEAVREPGGSRA